MTPEEAEELRRHDKEATDLTIDQEAELGRWRTTWAKWRPALERAQAWYEQTGDDTNARGFAVMIRDFDAAYQR